MDDYEEGEGRSGDGTAGGRGGASGDRVASGDDGGGGDSGDDYDIDGARYPSHQTSGVEETPMEELPSESLGPSTVDATAM